MTPMIPNIVLKHGSHKSPEEGLCLLEAVAYIAGEPHTDHPACTDPVLGAFGRALNDSMADYERELLVPLVEKLVGTAGDSALSLRRAMLLCDGVVRQIVPQAFDVIALPDVAKTLRELAPIVDEKTADAASDAADAASDAAYSAGPSAANAANAAYSAANAAYSAARAAYSAARSAAYDAAYSAARAARAASDAANAVDAAYSAVYSAARRSAMEDAVKLFTAAIELR